MFESGRGTALGAVTPPAGFGKKEEIMEIIVLEGAKNCGKTSALGMLYAFMANNTGANPQISPPPIEIPKAAKKDFAVTLDYTGKLLGRKKIAIYTAGDTKSMVVFGVNYAKATKAEILIAANSTGKPSSVLFAPYTIIQVFTKTPATSLPVNAANAANSFNLSFHADCLAENMKTAKSIEASL
jgi:hypothetical protein